MSLKNVLTYTFLAFIMMVYIWPSLEYRMISNFTSGRHISDLFIGKCFI